MSSRSDIEAKFQEAVGKHQLGDLARAAVLYRKVLARAPAHPDALQLLGLVEAQAGKYAAAADLLGRSVRIRPQDAATWINYGNVLLGLQRPVDALAAYDRAIALQQAGYAAFLNRGNALRDLGRPEEALTSYDEALRLEPDNADALCNRGNALRDLHRTDEAIGCYERVLTLNPGHADALCNRGVARKDLGQVEEAGRDFERALAIDPQHLTALNNLGDTLAQLGRHEDAAAVFGRLAEIAPEYDYAAGYAHYAQLRSCAWAGLEASSRRLVEGVRKGRRVAVPFVFVAVSESPLDQLRCAQTYVSHRFLAPPRPLWSGTRYGHERIRLAYLSADFHDHAVARQCAEVFEQHDRHRFEVIGLSYGPDRADAMRARLRKGFDQFIDLAAASDREIAERMRNMEVDIAIDLTGFTQGGRLGVLAHRPAPVQVSYIGFPGTLGAEFIDYILADPIVVPRTDESHYAEKVIYLPETYQANDSKRATAPTAGTRADAGLPENGFIFCCFNNTYKITPKVFDIWMRLLRDVQGSVLWLFEDNADAARNLRSEAERRGVPGSRLIFAPPVAPAEHRARHSLADLFLDTLPYNAHGTASEALWSGMPLLTCTGPTFAGRVGTSLLHALGLPEMVTPDLVTYEARAREFASSPEKLAALRAKLARNCHTHALFNTGRFTRHLESAFIQMWERAERSEAPSRMEIQAENRTPAP
jgi:protein O-GlcNAc transferase